MPLRIYKFHIPLQDVVTIRLPAGAKILSVQEQLGEIYFWALVETDTTVRFDKRTFWIIGTGNMTPKGIEHAIFLGTVLLERGRLVFHIFETVEVKN